MLMQRGLVLWRCGRTDEALEAYRRALPTLRRGPDRLMEARLYNNRSLVYVDRGELAAAEADLLRVAGAVPGPRARTGWPRTPRPTSAISTCAAATCRPRSASSTRPRPRTGLRGCGPRELLLTRGELLLSVGAFDEARQTAERAIEQLDRGRLAVAAGRGAAAAVPGAAGRQRRARRAAAAARAAATLFGRQRPAGLGDRGPLHRAAGGGACRRADPAAAAAGAAGGRPAGRDGLAGAGAGRPADRRPGRAGRSATSAPSAASCARPRQRAPGAAPSCGSGPGTRRRSSGWRLAGRRRRSRRCERGSG